MFIKEAKNSIIYLFGTIILGVLGFLSTMLLTRFLTQQVYAMYGLLVTFVNAVDAFICLGCGEAYTRFYYEHNNSVQAFFVKTLIIPIGVFIILALLLLEPSGTVINYIFGENLLWWVSLLIVVYIFCLLIHKFCQVTARMEEFALNYVFSSIISKSGFFLILLIVYLINQEISFIWIALSFIISTIFAILINCYVFFKVSTKPIRGALQIKNITMLKYGFPFAINNTLILIIPMIEKIILRSLLGWEILSIYTAALVFSSVIMMVQSAINNIWKPIVYKYYTDTNKFKSILHTVGIAITLIVNIGIALIILLRRWLVLLWDELYFSVYLIMPVVCYASCFNIVTSIYSVGINIKKCTFHMIIAPILQLFVSVVLSYILIPVLGIKGMAIASISGVVFSDLYRNIISLKLYNTGVSEIKSFLLWTVALTVSIVSMFLSSLYYDIFLSVILLFATIIIANKDLKNVAIEIKAVFAKNISSGE